MVTKRIATALIIIGLLVAAYPLLERAYVAVWQWQVMRQWKLTQANPDAAAVSDYDRLQAELDRAEQPDPNVPSGPAPVDPPKPPTPPPPTLGKLYIERIKLEVPILANTSRTALTLGVGQITGTSPLGATGNAGIAGHRRTFFHRLDEIQIGDDLVVMTAEGRYLYRVYEIKVVEPSDVTVLNRNQTDSILTLVTCTPPDTYKQRLIIHALKVGE